MLHYLNLLFSNTLLVSIAASLAGLLMMVRSIAREVLPYEVQEDFLSKFQNLIRSFSPELILIIEEIDGIVNNQIYTAADIYLGSKISPNIKTFKVSLPEKENTVRTKVEKDQDIIDTFNGVNFKWRHITQDINPKHKPGQSSSSVRYENEVFRLTFHKKHKEMVFDSYFPFILKESKRLREERKTLKIHTLSSDFTRKYSGIDQAWSSVNFSHPSTFETIAMDSDMKKEIVEDLETFVKRREFYRRVGKAWKRGYLLYGPPGTGKSSLIAAMANYLKFDIYDLELTDIHENSELRRLLIGTANRSIFVIEDIDCNLDFDDRSEEAQVLKAIKSAKANQIQNVHIHKDKENKVTLSGLLNFIDGLWSCCGDERIIIFTTNHKDRLDPVLLRPGRMDMHIHMSYCTPGAFRTLALNYHGISEHEHPLFLQVEPLLENAKVTPAEIAEQLLKKVDPDDALGGLIEFLHWKKKESDEMEERKLKEKEKEESEAEIQVEEQSC